MSDKFRGHKIELVGSDYIYSDTKEKVSETWKQRECGHCGLHNTPEWHDGCIGYIEGAINACCGHGNEAEAYIQYTDGTRIIGLLAEVVMKKEGVNI